jgi:subtilisin family serine protease
MSNVVAGALRFGPRGCAMRLYSFCLAAIAVFMYASVIRAEEISCYWDGDETIPCKSLVQTSVPGAFTGASVNDYVGARRFYSAGYTGQNTIVANVEAGLVWGGANGHETLQFMANDSSHFYVPTGADGGVDRHATCVGMIIAGRGGNGYQTGIAYGSDLRSGAIATSWVLTPPKWSGSFSTSWSVAYRSYNNFFDTAPADVINSSWGFPDATGCGAYAMGLDGLAAQCPNTTLVISAGNSGTSRNAVTGPAAGWNGISVGALANDGSNHYDAIASFSSRGPQDYFDPVNRTIYRVHAVVDLVAPGDSLTAAYYGGATGGNKNNTADGGPDKYLAGISGTSFSAPIVAGGVALLKSASKGRGLPTTSLDTRVIRAVLMNSADKTLPGWDNGQTVVGGVTVTTQSLDWTFGAGRLNLDTAYDQYLSGTKDLAGLAGGVISSGGWDYGKLAGIATQNDYSFDVALKGGSILDVTLSWFRDRIAGPDLSDLVDDGFANIDLEVWDASFTTLLATSKSLYNSAEELHFTLPADGFYGLRVKYTGQMFGETRAEDYGLAWSAVAVPEPGAVVLLAVAGLCLFGCRLRRTWPIMERP